MKKLFFGIIFCFFINYAHTQTLEVIEISGESPCNAELFYGRYTKHTGSLSPVVEQLLESVNSFCNCYNQEGTSNILFFGFEENENADYVGVQILGGTPGNGCGTGFGITAGGGAPYARTPQTGMCNLNGFEVVDGVDCEIEVIPTYGNPVPTLSEWGIILISFLFLILGITVIKNKTASVA